MIYFEGKKYIVVVRKLREKIETGHLMIKRRILEEE